MSNRPKARPSRSMPARPSIPDGGRSRVWWVVGAATVMIVIALGTALIVRRSVSSSEAPLDASAMRGRQVASAKGCLSCHSTTGNRSEGPTWKGLYGATQNLSSGATVVVDDTYLARAIRDPQDEVVAGYRPGMPTVPLTDDELQSLIAYIKALR